MMFARKARGRIALVPNQWSGSVQQYYHFLLGYLAPIMLWQESRRAPSITVRDCGPMNQWFGVLPKELDVEVMNVGHFLHVFAGKLQPSVVLRGLDYPDEFSSDKLRRFRELMLTSTGTDRNVTTSAKSISVINRIVTDPFYSTAESEIDMAGAQRRSVPNLSDWVQQSSRNLSIQMFEATTMSPSDQVREFAGTQVLVGQHGAGLTNMVFMKPGSAVIEIHPPLPFEAVDTFASLARACGHTYVRVPQADVHAPVDELVLTEVVSRFS